MYLNIDKNYILKHRQCSLKESFKKAIVDDTASSIANFINNFNNMSISSMIENLSLLPEIDSQMSFSKFNTIIESTDFSQNQLNTYKLLLMAKKEKTHNSDYINKLNNSLSIIENKIKIDSNTDTVKYDMLYENAASRIHKYSTFESYIGDELETMVYTINSFPHVIDDYEKLLRKIKLDENKTYYSNYPEILNNNTKLIIAIKLDVTSDTLNLLLSMPSVIANKIIKSNPKNKDIKSFISIFEKQIYTINEFIKINQDTNILHLRYAKELSRAKDSISELLVHTENIACMQPDIVDSEEIIYDMEDSVTRLVLDSDDELNVTELENFARLYSLYEGITDTYRKASSKVYNAVEKGTRNAINKGKSAMSNIDRAHQPLKRAAASIDRSFMNMVAKIKSADKKERTKLIVEGNFHSKIHNFIKKTLMGTGTIKIGMTIAAISIPAILAAPHLTVPALIIILLGYLVGAAIDKKNDKKVRREILGNLEDELEITEEKIKYAESKGDNKEKYELIRIRNKLKREIDRVRFNMDK